MKNKEIIEKVFEDLDTFGILGEAEDTDAVVFKFLGTPYLFDVEKVSQVVSVNKDAKLVIQHIIDYNKENGLEWLPFLLFMRSLDHLGEKNDG